MPGGTRSSLRVQQGCGHSSSKVLANPTPNHSDITDCFREHMPPTLRCHRPHGHLQDQLQLSQGLPCPFLGEWDVMFMYIIHSFNMFL